MQAALGIGLALALIGLSDGSAASLPCAAASSPCAPALRGAAPGVATVNAPRGLRLRGGGLPFRYQDSWSEIVIKMPIDEGIKGKDIVYKLTPTSLDLGIKGQDLYVSGELWCVCVCVRRV